MKLGLRTLEPSAAIDQLRRIPVFSDWTDGELGVLARAARWQHRRKGEVILLQGEPAQLAFVLMSGVVDVLLEWPDGREFLLARLSAGAHFGEMALLDLEPRSATVVAATEADILVLGREAFLGELLAHPPAMLRLLATLSSRLRKADALLGGLAFDDATTRLAQFLVANARPRDGGLSVELTQTELASLIGTTRQTVARILQAWRRQGLVETRRNGTVVRHPEGLAGVGAEDGADAAEWRARGQSVPA